MALLPPTGSRRLGGVRSVARETPKVVRREHEGIALPLNSLTPRGRRVLVEAASEAEAHDQAFIGTEHLLVPWVRHAAEPGPRESWPRSLADLRGRPSSARTRYSLSCTVGEWYFDPAMPSWSMRPWPCTHAPYGKYRKSLKQASEVPGAKYFVGQAR